MTGRRHFVPSLSFGNPSLQKTISPAEKVESTIQESRDSTITLFSTFTDNFQPSDAAAVKMMFTSWLTELSHRRLYNHQPMQWTVHLGFLLCPRPTLDFRLLGFKGNLEITVQQALTSTRYNVVPYSNKVIKLYSHHFIKQSLLLM